MTSYQRTFPVQFDVSEQDSMQELTGHDLAAIRRHFGKDTLDLGAEMLTAITWALLNGAGQKVDVAAVKAMKVGEMKAYYAPMTDPEEEEGKG